MSSTDLVERGVYTMPFRTETGGMVLVSVTSTGRRLRMTEIPAGDNPLPGLEVMWAELDAQDPPRPRPMLVATA